MKPGRILPHDLQHSALKYPTVDDLLSAYSRLKEMGFEPVLGATRGETTAFYYLDPHGNCIELFADNFDDCKKSCASAGTSPKFAAHSIGALVDPEKMIAARRVGTSLEELHCCAYAGKFSPSKSLDPEALIQIKRFALKSDHADPDRGFHDSP